MSQDLLDQLSFQACYDRALIFAFICYLGGVLVLLLAIWGYFQEGLRGAIHRLFFVTRDKDSVWIFLILLFGVGCAFIVFGVDHFICVN